MRHKAALSELEHELMDRVWQAGGPVTAEEVREALAPKRSLKDSTIRTVMRRLERKGYLAHTVEGRTYVYRGLDVPQHLAASAVRQIIDRFCGGSLEQLLVGMVENRVTSERELQELARRIAVKKSREV
jgi:BlaI family transcriptional regulator, penicillinase repressor